MSNDLNRCDFIGRLGKDPESRFLPNGDAVTSFSIAVGEAWKDKNSGEKRETTEWVRCVAWRKLGEICAEYLQKGSQVYISGKMTTRKWTDKDGNDKYSTELVVDKMQMLGPKSDNQRERTEEPAPRQSPAAGGQKGSFADMDDDIPFAPIGRGIGGHAI